jgi:hypothetical protein
LLLIAPGDVRARFQKTRNSAAEQFLIAHGYHRMSRHAGEAAPGLLPLGLQRVDESSGISKSGASNTMAGRASFLIGAAAGNPCGTGISGSSSLLSR